MFQRILSTLKDLALALRLRASFAQMCIVVALESVLLLSLSLGQQEVEYGLYIDMCWALASKTLVAGVMYAAGRIAAQQVCWRLMAVKGTVSTRVESLERSKKNIYKII